MAACNCECVFSILDLEPPPPVYIWGLLLGRTPSDCFKRNAFMVTLRFRCAGPLRRCRNDVFMRWAQFNIASCVFQLFTLCTAFSAPTSLYSLEFAARIRQVILYRFWIFSPLRLVLLGKLVLHRNCFNVFERLLLCEYLSGFVTQACYQSL